MSAILKVLAWSFTLVIALFVGMFLPGVGRVAESLLGPGYESPKAYWGGVHDPIQLGIALVLTWIMHTISVPSAGFARLMLGVVE